MSEQSETSTEEVPQQIQFSLTDFMNKKSELKNQLSATFETLKGKPKHDRKDVIKVLYKLNEVVSMLDNLTEILVRDLFTIDQRFNNLEQQIFSLTTNYTVVRTVLADKGVFTEDEILSTWESKVKPDLTKKIEEAKNPKSQIEAPSNLVDPQGNPL